ncbi:hypothetical protein B0H14DRAFT_2987920 [Mycena olivaceomarginata]|nr:hypothetical protein B0H14DRAFT_2987920 [Mycena olivaceomarginata]
MSRFAFSSTHFLRLRPLRFHTADSAHYISWLLPLRCSKVYHTRPTTASSGEFSIASAAHLCCFHSIGCPSLSSIPFPSHPRGIHTPGALILSLADPRPGFPCDLHRSVTLGLRPLYLLISGHLSSPPSASPECPTASGFFTALRSSTAVRRHNPRPNRGRHSTGHSPSTKCPTTSEFSTALCSSTAVREHNPRPNRGQSSAAAKCRPRLLAFKFY